MYFEVTDCQDIGNFGTFYSNKVLFCKFVLNALVDRKIEVSPLKSSFSSISLSLIIDIGHIDMEDLKTISKKMV